MQIYIIFVKCIISACDNMKNISFGLIIFYCIIGLAFLFPFNAEGQTPIPDFNVRQSMDTDFMLMRQNEIPTFRHTYDDWIQYAPGVAVVGLKVSGLPGMTKAGRFAVSSAFSVAIMAAVVNGVKYTVKRERPDLSARNSFPSGHSATTFMTATILHKEYGWKYPWISILGYTTATVTGASRILNNKHWMSDIIGGAAIGIGSVHLGYYLTGLIFKEKGLQEGWHRHLVFIDDNHKYWGADLKCGRRFILSNKENKDNSILPFRGSAASAEVEIPLMPMTGIIANIGCNSLVFKNNTSMNAYNALAGLYWTLPFARILEVQAKGAIGYAWHKLGNGIDVQLTASFNILAGENFKMKAFAEYETFSFSEQKPFLNSFVLGWSTGFCW